MKKDKTKNPLKNFKRVLVAGALCFTCTFGAIGLVGCSDGQNGKDGSQWYSGTTNIELVTTGNNGDFYYDTDDYKLYQKENGSWVLKVENFGKPGTNGTNGTNGQDGQNGINGQDGSNVFIGYDGYIWQDGLKTEFKIEKDATLTENVVEDTIGAYTTMQYFAGNYVDLTTNRIALMANYKPNAKLTQYSGTKIIEIQVVAESAGTLHIGTAKVSDIVTARTNGSTYTATTTSYNVVAGVNTITFSTPLEVGEDETIVLGGSNSTAKVYVANNIPVSDEQGNFTLLNGSSNASVISKTGSHADTLAVRVKAEVLGTNSVSFFPNITTEFPENKISTMGEVNNSYAPFVYQHADFSGKTITSIGVPVGKLPSSGQAYMTVYKIKKSVVTSKKNTSDVVSNAIGRPIQLVFENAVVNTWAYAECNIQLAEDETLAFGAPSGDTLVWKYGKNNSNYATTYGFYTKSTPTGEALTFDIKVENKSAIQWSGHLEKLSEKEQETGLKNILSGKKLSILGDSISTFSGVSNNSEDGLADNAIYYSSQIAQTDTYWQQIIDAYDMSLCVNNAWSGSYLSMHKPNQNADKDVNGSISCGMARADNLAKVDGTTPDYIIVYIGINDLNAGVSSDIIATAYQSMLNTITSTYPNAKVFCINMPNRNTGNSPIEYNLAIKNAIDEHENVYLVDMYNSDFSGTTYQSNSLDNLHPNAKGMDYMTNLIIETMKKALITD